MKKHYDVAVIGGGTAGVVAAVQAARAGADTLLVERTGMLGGTVTNCNVHAPGLFYARHTQVIRGIGWELVSETLELAGQQMPDFCKPVADPLNHKVQVPMNTALYALVCDKAVVSSGASVLLETSLAAIREEKDGKHLTLCTREGLTEVSAAVVIDCTGDAAAVRMAGYGVEKGEELQPATYSFTLSGYDRDALDLPALTAAADQAVAAGELRYIDLGWKTYGADFRILRGHGENGNHIDLPVCADTSEGKTAYDLEGRAAVLRAYRFLRKQKGLENLRLDALTPECGIRETARIRGKKTVTCEDYLAGKRYGDDVCYTFYPIDLHCIKTDMRKVYPGEGVIPTIPRGAMLPEGSRNLLVAGRCVASDREANSAIRVECTAMAEGQAAGALAYLAVTGGCDVEEVPMEKLYDLLEAHGAIVPRN